MEMSARDPSAAEQQLDKRQPQSDNPDLLHMTAGMTIAIGHYLFGIEAINIWVAVAVLVVMLGAAVCPVLLIMATRRATRRQIQANLLVLSEQFSAL